MPPATELMVAVTVAASLLRGAGATGGLHSGHGSAALGAALRFSCFGAVATMPIGGWTLYRKRRDHRAGRDSLGASGAAFGCSWHQSTRSLSRWLSRSALSSSAWPVRCRRRDTNRTNAPSPGLRGCWVGLPRRNATYPPGYRPTWATPGELVQAGRLCCAVVLPPRCHYPRTCRGTAIHEFH